MEVSQGRALACTALENAWGPSELPPLFLPAAGTELASGTHWISFVVSACGLVWALSIYSRPLT